MPTQKATIRKRDVSIEYAHIYTNNQLGEEHTISLQVLQKLQEELNKKKKTFLLMVLIDDYSFPDPSFDYGSFIWFLEQNGFKPKVIFRESQLIPLCDEVIRQISKEKMRDQIMKYVQVKKYPCSLIIAAWYLLRLGHLTYPLFEKKYVTSKLINILPESFKPYEEKALEIIASTKFAGAEKYIEYHYFSGRQMEKKSEKEITLESSLQLPNSIREQVSLIAHNLSSKPVEKVENFISRKKSKSLEEKRQNAKRLLKILEKETSIMRNKILTQITKQQTEIQNQRVTLLNAIDDGDESILAEYGLLFKHAWIRDIVETIITSKYSIAIRAITASPQTYLWGFRPDDLDIVGIELTKVLRKIDPESQTIRTIISINEFFDRNVQRPLTEYERNNYVVTVLNFLESQNLIFSDDLAGFDYYVSRESEQVVMVDKLINQLRKSHFGKIVIEEDGNLYFKPSHEYLKILNTLSQVTKKELAQFGILLKSVDGIPTTCALNAASYLNPIYKYFMHLYILDKKMRVNQEKTYALLHAVNIIRGERSHEIYYDAQMVSPEIITYCISKILQRGVKDLFQSYDAYDEWSTFDSYEYVERNYKINGEILPEDKQLITHAIQSLQQVGIAPKSFKQVADIGSGPNLYPSMIVIPFLEETGTFDLLEFSENRKYLQKVVDQTIDYEHAKVWHKFEDFMIDVGGEIYKGCEEKAKKKVKIQYGDIFSLPKEKYELITSYFVAESIVDSQMPFREAMQSMRNALKQNGIVIIAHMVGSEGWPAGEGTHFPAVNLSVEQIKQAYYDADLEILSTIAVGHDTEKVREGYHGMVLVIAQRSVS